MSLIPLIRPDFHRPRRPGCRTLTSTDGTGYGVARWLSSPRELLAAEGLHPAVNRASAQTVVALMIFVAGEEQS